MRKTNAIRQLIGCGLCLFLLFIWVFFYVAVAQERGQVPGSTHIELSTQAEIMRDERLYRDKTFCVSISLDPKINVTPVLHIEAYFSNKVSGFFEIDGKRVVYWKDGATPNWVQNITKGGVSQITVHVDPDARVEKLWIYGTPPITKITKISCT